MRGATNRCSCTFLTIKIIKLLIVTLSTKYVLYYNVFFLVQLKTSESQYSVLMPDDSMACCYAAADAAASLPPLLYNSPPNNRFGDTNKTNLNGSIITLTMKNNHLIVETEERVPVINYNDTHIRYNATIIYYIV